MATSKWAGLTILVLSSLALAAAGATASSSRSRGPQRPTAIAISAQPSSTDVVYQAEVTPTGATNYAWALGPNPQGHEATCGVFKSTGSVATWTLHDKSAGATCPDTTAAGSITLTFTFGHYHCTAVDTAGSAGGKYRYNPAQACKLTGAPPPSPKPPAVLSRAQIADRVGLARDAETQALHALGAGDVRGARSDLDRSLALLGSARASSARTAGMSGISGDLARAIAKDHGAVGLLGIAGKRTTARALVNQALADKRAALAALIPPKRPTAIAISAQPSSTDVVYQAEVTPTGATNYAWALGPNPQGHEATCGVFKSTGSVATWTLHDKSAGATCPDTTAAGSITLTFTFGHYHCTAVDTAGSAGGKYRYNPAQACKLVSR